MSKFRNAGAMMLCALGAAIFVLGVAVAIEFADGSDGPRAVPTAQAATAPLGARTATPVPTPDLGLTPQVQSVATPTLPSAVPPTPTPTPALASFNSHPTPAPTASPLPTVTPTPADRAPSPTPEPVPPVLPTPQPVLGGPLAYTCVWPISGSGDMTLTVDLPVQAPVAGVLPQTPVLLSAQLSTETTQMLNIIGATSFNGTVRTTLKVESPDGYLTLRPSLVIPTTTVPASGTMTFTASRTLTSMHFTHSGTVVIRAADVMLQLSAVAQDGSPLSGIDLSAIACHLKNPELNPVLARFDVAVN
jgi:hypothetical protein